MNVRKQSTTDRHLENWWQPFTNMRAFQDNPPANVPEFFHGNTYAGCPVAASASLAALDIYEQEGLFTCASGEKGQYWENSLHGLRDLPQMIDIRNYGLMGAVTFNSMELPANSLGPKIHQQCYENGLLCRS